MIQTIKPTNATKQNTATGQKIKLVVASRVAKLVDACPLDVG